MIFPTTKVINGEGKPRMIVDTDVYYISKGGTVYSSDGVVEANGATYNIIGHQIVGSNPAILQINNLTPVFYDGEFVLIAGNSGSTPAINGNHIILSHPDDDKWEIDEVCTVIGNNGTIRHLSDPELNNLSINMRISSTISAVGSYPAEPVYAKIIGFSNGKIIIDQWQGGQPTDGNAFTVDGWIADLPYCNKLTEKFTKYSLVHKLFRGRRETKDFGYYYECNLDYSKHVWGDTIFDLKHHLNVVETKSLILMPRADRPEFNYRVYLKPDAGIQLALFGNAQGHEKFSLTYEGKDLIQTFPIVSGYGTGYGQNYGNQL